MINSPNTILSKLNTYKNCGYQSQRIKLTSPLIHIGRAESELNPFDYVERENKLIYFPNQDALIAALSKQGELDNYIEVIKEYTERNNNDYLNRNRENIISILKNCFGEE